MKLGQTSAIYFGSKLISSVISFVAMIYFARLLGSEVIGIYSLCLTVVAWLELGGRVGVSQAVVKRMSATDQDADAFLAAGAIVIGVMFTILALGLVVFQNAVEAYVGAPILPLIILLLGATLFYNLAMAGLKGNHLVHVYASLSPVKNALQSVFQLVLVVAGLALSGMLIGYAAGWAVIGLVGVLYLRPRVSVPTREHFLSLASYAKYSWLGSVKSQSFSWVDIAVLGFFVGSGLVGVYTIAWTVASFLNVFGNAISTTLFPEISRSSAESGVDAISGLLDDALTYAGLILIPGLVGGALLGDRLLLLYGEEFVSGVEVLVLLIVACLIYGYKKQLLNTLNAVDRPDLAFRANGAFIVTNVALNVLLVYLYGWVGAAVATTLSVTVGLVFAFHYTRRLIDFTVPYGEIGRQWIAALLMGIIVFGLRTAGEETMIAENNEIFVLLLVGLGAIVYFLTYLGISQEFRATVRRNIPFNVPYL